MLITSVINDLFSSIYMFRSVNIVLSVLPFTLFFKVQTAMLIVQNKNEIVWNHVNGENMWVGLT